MNTCPEHSGVCERNESVKEGLSQEILDRKECDRELWKGLNQEILVRKEGDRELWKGLNQMKAWVIGGMGSTILAMALFILNLVVHPGK